MLSEKPWNLQRLMRFLLCLLGCFSFMLCLYGVAQHFFGPNADENSPVAVVLNSLALDGSILMAVGLFLVLEQFTWADAFGFNSPQPARALTWGALTGIACAPIGQEMNQLIAQALEHWHVEAAKEQAVESLQNAPPGFVRIYLIVFAIVIAPVAEETLFRGILYPAIRRLGFPRVALWGTSLLFALIHYNLTAFLPLTLLAAALALLYEKTNNLLSCIIAHSLFNLAGVTLLYFYNGAAPGH